MALPAMITGFGEQSANYGAVVGQSLQQLGQRIKQQLALQQFQKDAQAVLPALQQTYTSAMDKIQAGEVTEGYRDILNAQLQFGSSQNPFIAQMNQMAGSIAEQAASNYMKTKQYEMQYGPRPTTTTTMPGYRVPTSQELADPNYRPDTTVIDTTVGDVTTGGDMEARFVGEDMTQGTPEQREAQRAADQEYGTYEDADRAAAAGLPVMQEQGISFGFGSLSKYKPEEETINRTREAIISFKARPREEKDAFREKISETDTEYTPPQGRVAKPFSGIIGFEGAKFIEGPADGGLKIASIEEEYDEKGPKVKRKFEPANADDVKTYNAFVENARKVNAFVARNSQLRSIIEAAGGNLNRIDIEDRVNPNTDQTEYYATIDGKDYGTLSTAENFNEKFALEFLQEATATIDENGWRVIAGEAPAAAPAPAAGGGSVAERVRAQYGKKEGAAQPTAAQPAPAAQAPEATLEERIASKTKSAAMPARTATPQQQATLERTRQSQTKSNLQSEKTRLERIIYETPRGGQRKLKPGLTQQDADVKEVLAKITEINKQLEGL